MAILDAKDLDRNALNPVEYEYLNELRKELLFIAQLYGEASQTFGPSTDRITFMDFIFERCKQQFQWNPQKLQNIDEMKKRLFQTIMAKSKDPQTNRPRGIIPCIASYTQPKARATGEQMSDLQAINARVQQDAKMIRALLTQGEVRTKALATLAAVPNRRNTPEVELEMKINARKAQLQDLVTQYKNYQELVTASGIVDGRFFYPENASKNQTVRTQKIFDDFLGQGGQQDLNDLVDLADLT